MGNGPATTVTVRRGAVVVVRGVAVGGIVVGEVVLTALDSDGVSVDPDVDPDVDPGVDPVVDTAVRSGESVSPVEPPNPEHAARTVITAPTATPARWRCLIIGTNMGRGR